MTIISTHRIHTYKASASPHHRDLSPKKVFTQNYKFDKKHTSQMKIATTIEPDPIMVLQALLTNIMNYMPTIQFTTPENSVVDDDFTMDQDEQLDEEELEEAWARYEYAEYLADF